jgi:hypothetical protein
MTTNVKFFKANIARKEIETSRTCKELKHYAISYGDSSEDPKKLESIYFISPSIPCVASYSLDLSSVYSFITLSCTLYTLEMNLPNLSTSFPFKVKLNYHKINLTNRIHSF